MTEDDDPVKRRFERSLGDNQDLAFFRLPKQFYHRRGRGADVFVRARNGAVKARMKATASDSRFDMPTLTKPDKRWSFTLRGLMATTAGIAVVIAAVGYLVCYPATVERLGREKAESDWFKGQAMLVTGHQLVRHQNYEVRYFFDQATGLELESGVPGYRDYYEAYNARVRELLREHGTPDWSRKEHIVDAALMAAMLNSTIMIEVTDWPHEPSPSISLFRRGSGRHGGRSIYDSLSIDTPHGLYGGGLENDPVYVGRSPQYPDIVFVRVADYTVFAFHEDGKKICTLQDDTAFAAAVNDRGH